MKCIFIFTRLSCTRRKIRDDRMFLALIRARARTAAAIADEQSDSIGGHRCTYRIAYINFYAYITTSPYWKKKKKCVKRKKKYSAHYGKIAVQFLWSTPTGPERKSKPKKHKKKNLYGIFLLILSVTGAAAAALCAADDQYFIFRKNRPIRHIFV